MGFGIYYTLSPSDIYHLSKSFFMVMSSVSTFISVNTFIQQKICFIETVIK